MKRLVIEGCLLPTFFQLRPTETDKPNSLYREGLCVDGNYSPQWGTYLTVNFIDQDKKAPYDERRKQRG